MDVIWRRLCINMIWGRVIFICSELGGVGGVCEMCMCLARGGVGG